MLITQTRQREQFGLEWVHSGSSMRIPRAGLVGKARRYLHITKTQIKSGEATKRIINKRSKIIQKVEKVCSTPSGTSLSASLDVN